MMPHFTRARSSKGSTVHAAGPRGQRLRRGHSGTPEITTAIGQGWNSFGVVLRISLQTFVCYNCPGTSCPSTGRPLRNPEPVGGRPCFSGAHPGA